ncbi:hypothetical protein B0H13DRAFT_2035665 [Mycena leptocephala]|nr:hypothetical protein B0H13DRAFT_2035665 [Mycena leptocephala]
MLVNSLRAILRNMLSSKTPGLVSAFLTSTRARIYHRSGGSVVAELQQPFSDTGDAPAPQLLASLARARMLYGSGLGFASLAPLAAVGLQVGDLIHCGIIKLIFHFARRAVKKSFREVRRWTT